MEIDRLRAVELLELFHVVRTAVNADKSDTAAFVRKMETRARGEDDNKSEIVLASNADLDRFLRGGM